MMTAREMVAAAASHLAKASKLIENVDAVEKQLVERHRSPEARLQDSISGYTRLNNECNRWTIEVASAHASTGLGFAVLAVASLAAKGSEEEVAS